MKRSDLIAAYKKGLERLVPPSSLLRCAELMASKPIQLQIKKDRKTKHGDFKPAYGPRKKAVITINGSLAPKPFLLVLIHEIAHQHVWEEFGRKAAPHGDEWKSTFRSLFVPFLSCFEDKEQRVLIQYFKNPSAATLSNTKIFECFMRDALEHHLVKDLAIHTEFELLQNPGVKYKLEEKRRTRFLCTCLKTKKQFLIHGQAQVL